MSGGSCERGNAVREPPVICEVSTPNRRPIEPPLFSLRTRKNMRLLGQKVRLERKQKELERKQREQERMQKEQATGLRRNLCRRLNFTGITQQEDSDEEDSKRSLKLLCWKKKKKKEKTHWSPPKREWADAYVSPPPHVKRALRKIRMNRLNQDESTLTPQRRCIDEYVQGILAKGQKKERPPPVARLRGLNIFANQKKKARGWMWAPSESTESTTSLPPSTVPVEERVDATPRSVESVQTRRLNVVDELEREGRYRQLFDQDDSYSSESEENVMARVANPPWIAEYPLMQAKRWDSPEPPPGSLFYRGGCQARDTPMHTPFSSVYSESRTHFTPKNPSLRTWERTPRSTRRTDTMSSSNYTPFSDYHTPSGTKPYLDRVLCAGTDFATPACTNARLRAMEMYFDPSVRPRAATPRQPRPSEGFLEKLTDFVPGVQDIAAVPCAKALNLLDKYYSSGVQP